MTPEEILAQANTTEILDHFKQAGLALYQIVKNANTNTSFGRYRREQLVAIARIIQRLDQRSKDWVEQNIPGLMQEASKATKQQIVQQGETAFLFQFSGVSEEAVHVMTAKASIDFGNTVLGLKRSGERAILDKRALKSEIVQWIISGSSVSRTQEELLQVLKEQGFDVLTARNGRRFSLENYTNMLVRTQTLGAFNTASKEQMLSAGRRYALFPTIRPDIDGHDICNEWERKKYIDLLTDVLPPQSTHPNCRHVPQPVSFAELKADRPDLYENAVRFFNQTKASLAQ